MLIAKFIDSVCDTIFAFVSSTIINKYVLIKGNTCLNGTSFAYLAL